MKSILKNIKAYFYIGPMITTIILSLIGAFMFSIITWIINIIQDSGHIYFNDILSVGVVYALILLPLVLTLQNIVFLFSKPKSVEQEKIIKRWEVTAIIIGVIFSFISLGLTEIVGKDWHVQLYNVEKHTPLETQSSLTIIVIVLVAILSYIILRFFDIKKLPPLFAVFCISALYLGMAECVLWIIQIFDIKDLAMNLLCLLPFNCVLIAIRTIKNAVYQQTDKEENVPDRFKQIGILLNNTANWPWVAFIAAIPLLGIIVAVLLVFGQEPDSFIKAWTETADWTMSQKIPPQNIPKDGHYLCTVAAGGHREVVKPIRTGKRHGHTVVVNRQLCIANAFEQLLEERVPKCHSLVRNLYDKTGYPIAKHINSPYVADTIYFIMKPLEWIFLLSLYLLDVKPENRIALQYPHSDLPALE